jgi:hypothetical protein
MIQVVALSLWGFLVGFVGWTSCFLLPDFIVDRIFGEGLSAKLKGVARLLVLFFLMFSVLLIIAMVPLLFYSVGHSHSIREWKSMFGVAFFGSLAGLVTNGAFRKFGGGDSLP